MGQSSEEEDKYLGSVEQTSERSQSDPIHISDASTGKKASIEPQSRAQSQSENSSNHSKSNAAQKSKSIYEVPILKEVLKS